jgi:hypothetical protein
VNIDQEQYGQLERDARLEVGRAVNAWSRYKNGEAEMKAGRLAYATHIIRLRAVHKLSIMQIAKLLGVPRDNVARFSAAYQDPSYGGERANPRQKRGKYARRPEHVAGGRPLPPGVFPDPQ